MFDCVMNTPLTIEQVVAGGSLGAVKNVAPGHCKSLIECAIFELKKK